LKKDIVKGSGYKMHQVSGCIALDGTTEIAPWFKVRSKRREEKTGEVVIGIEGGR
jgi:hypothetical protein